MQCSLKVGLLPIVRNQLHRLSLDLAANLIATSKQIRDQEASTLPLQRRAQAMLARATTDSAVAQEPLSAHQASLSGQLSIQPTTQTGLARFTPHNRHKQHKL